MSTISAKVIADSVSPSGKRIVTLELEYPRFIHAEFMTHRVFSRNAASSRAIPVAKVIEQVRTNPARPIHWGKNQSGMQAKEQLEGQALENAQDAWTRAAWLASNIAEEMVAAGLHKQVANRILEPFQLIKVVVTSTEWDNFFTLRCHPDAQPEIQELATKIRKAMDTSIPFKLHHGEWHLPYVSRSRYGDGAGEVIYGENLSLEDAIQISASCCAQVSYRKLDDSLEKAKDVYARLVDSEPMHASPFEHQASPLIADSHKALCGNFVGWVQNRKFIEYKVVL